MSRLSYAHGASATPLLGETIGERLERTAQRLPDHEALVVCHQDVRLTYGELLAQVDRVARGLLALGVERGDRIGLWAPNCAEWVLVQYATARIGAILVNVNPAYRAGELEYVLNQSGCRMLVTAPAFKQSDYVATVEQVRPSCPQLERTIVLGDATWNDLLAAGEAIDEAALRTRGEALQFDDPINIQYTSGTTGFPKGATLTHHNILNNGYLCGEVCRYDEADRVCVPVPFYHCFGMVIGNLACVAHGATVVVPAASFEPEPTLRAVQEERCTSLYGVPTMFIAMLGHERFEAYDLRTLRTGIMAGSPCPETVMREVIARMHMREVTIAYGMTETSPVSTQTAVDDAVELRVTTVGRVHPHVEVKLVDPASDAIVARGETGELLTRGYSVMRGYWNDPEQTAAAVDAAGWMHTGDLATMDEDGFVRIVGRSKDMIIRGGENIYPRELEELLHAHPAIADVQVIGVPDERFGEEVMAVAIARDGATLDDEELRAWCRERIAHYKVPRYVRIVDELPMTVTGKVQKFKLREWAIAQLETAS